MNDLGPLDIPLEYTAAPMVQAVPKEVLAVLPTDPHEQLKLAHKISSRAYLQKVSSLESEVAHLRRVLADKDGYIRTLETRLTSCQLELQDAIEKARASADAQSKLAGEKSALVNTVRSLNRHVAKLEGFKRNLLTSLQASEEVADELGAGLAAADLAGEALVQEVLEQEQLHAAPHATPVHHTSATSPYRGINGSATDSHLNNHQPPAYAHANGGTAAPRSGGGSRGTSPTAGYSLHGHHREDPIGGGGGGYEQAARSVEDRAKPAGYGSPLDLPSADYSNASELSTGFEGEQAYGGHQLPDLHRAGDYAAADIRTPAIGRYTAPATHYGTGGREPDLARRTGTPPDFGRREPDMARTGLPPDYGRREPPVLAPPAHADNGRLPDPAQLRREEGRSAPPAPAAGRQGTPLDGKEFFRRARARLPTEPFARFLAAIKELNAGHRTRIDTLRLAREIFCPRDADLYSAFEGLFNRHLPAQ